MAFIHGKSAAVLVGAVDLSAYFNEASASQDVETAETTTFGSSAKTYITGLKDGTISVSGLFDGATDGIDATLASIIGQAASLPVTVSPTTPTLGGPAFSANVKQTSYEISSPVGDVVSANAEFQADGGIDRGLLLAPKVSVSATGQQTSVDNAASSANGGVAYLHLTANAQTGTSIVTVQHSADNNTFADLVTFATLNAGITGSEKVVVAPGTTVNRYLRAQYTLAGTGAVTITVTFARR